MFLTFINALLDSRFFRLRLFLTLGNLQLIELLTLLPTVIKILVFILIQK